MLSSWQDHDKGMVLRKTGKFFSCVRWLGCRNAKKDSSAVSGSQPQERGLFFSNHQGDLKIKPEEVLSHECSLAREIGKLHGRIEELEDEVAFSRTNEASLHTELARLRVDARVENTLEDQVVSLTRDLLAARAEAARRGARAAEPLDSRVPQLTDDALRLLQVYFDYCELQE
jgi:hypothetical protein